MFFQQVYDKTLAQASYVIGCQVSGEAIVIDPKRDIDTYLEIVSQHQMQITHIAETHIHADFLCGSRELAAVTGGQLCLSDEGGQDWQYEFDHVGLREGDSIRIGNLTLEVLHTPGHTPESISFLLIDHPATESPVMLFSGDCVFVGDVGRPDLLDESAGYTGTKELGAKQLFSSIQRIKSLPDYIQLWPGHGAGSACGKSLGAVPSSTIGYEKIRNWAFLHTNIDAFCEELLSDQPEAPYYFGTMKRWNKVDRKLLPTVPNHAIISVDKIEKDSILIDTRHKHSFAAGHITGSINIQNNNSLANWAGWMLSYHEQLSLIVDPGREQEVTRKLMRIGMDNIAAFVHDLPIQILTRSAVIDTVQLEQMMAGKDVVLLDVRSRGEYQKGHIPGAIHWFVGRMAKELPLLYKDKDIVVYCQSGDRATLAYSYLKQNDFDRVYNYSNSYAEWTRLGKPVEVSL